MTYERKEADTYMERTNSPVANRKIKDSIFCSLFREKENALSLYNAVNGTHYTDTEQLEMMTVENSVYLGYNEDNSFIIDSILAMYEHQSTYNPNMPVRFLLYISDVYKRYIEEHNVQKQLYTSHIVHLPAPQAIVFYNGLQDDREQYELRLSDSFDKKGSIELTVKVYNINLDKNKELLTGCRVLGEYSEFVDLLRKNKKKYENEMSDKTMAYNTAVDETVEYCIKHGILKDYLSRNRKEVGSMALSDVTIEDYGDIRFEEGVEKGVKKGEVKSMLKSFHRVVKYVKSTELAQSILDCPDNIVSWYMEITKNNTPEEAERMINTGEYTIPGKAEQIKKETR